jgi:hypothetical protein
MNTERITALLIEACPIPNSTVPTVLDPSVTGAFTVISESA